MSIIKKIKSSSLITSILFLLALSGCKNNLLDKDISTSQIQSNITKKGNLSLLVSMNQNNAFKTKSVSSENEQKTISFVIRVFLEKDKTKDYSIEHKTKASKVKVSFSLPLGYTSKIYAEVKNQNKEVIKKGETENFKVEENTIINIPLTSIGINKINPPVSKVNTVLTIDSNIEELSKDGTSTPINQSNITPVIEVENIEPNLLNYNYRNVGISSSEISASNRVIYTYENNNQVFYGIKDSEGKTIKNSTILSNGYNPKVVSLADGNNIIVYQNESIIYLSKVSPDGVVLKKDIIVSYSVPKYSQYGLGIDPSNASKILVSWDTLKREAYFDSVSRIQYGEYLLQHVNNLIDVNFQLFDNDLNKIGFIYSLQGIRANNEIKAVKFPNESSKFPIGAIASNPADKFSIQIKDTSTEIVLPFKYNWNIYSNDIFASIAQISIDKNIEYSLISKLTYVSTGGTFAAGSIGKPFCLNDNNSIICENKYSSGGNSNTLFYGIGSSKVILNNSIIFSSAYFDDKRAPYNELGKEFIAYDFSQPLDFVKNTFAKSNSDYKSAVLYNNEKGDLSIRYFNAFEIENRGIYGFAGYNSFNIIKYMKDLKIASKSQSGSAAFLKDNKMFIIIQRGENLLKYLIDSNYNIKLLDVERLNTKMNKNDPLN